MKAKQVVTTKYAQPQIVRYVPRERRPVSAGVVRNQRFAKSLELKARKTVYDRK
jgi:hypothetical protein